MEQGEKYIFSPSKKTFLLGSSTWHGGRRIVGQEVQGSRVVGKVQRAKIIIIIITSGQSHHKNCQKVTEFIPTTGIEPAISPLGGVRLIHWATQAS